MLYIVATPIGNLKDISQRAIEVLKEVDLILCEDTRWTQKLLNFYQIKTRTLSYHQHSKLNKIEYIAGFLKKGMKLALVSDAGTPGIADPGNKLIDYLISQFPNLKIVPIPGPSALASAASIAGIAMDRFLFLGYLPTKKRRRKFFKEIISSKYPVIFYESRYRILKTLQELKEINSELYLVVCRELTKKFESIYRGDVNKALSQIQKDKIKGEFVIIVSNIRNQNVTI